VRVPANFSYVCGTWSLDRCRNQQCDNLHCQFFSLFRCFRRWWIRCYVPGTSSFVLSFCLSSWAHSVCREGVPRRANVRICVSRRWVFRTCSIHTLLTGSLYRTTCSSFFLFKRRPTLYQQTPSSSSSEEISLFCARSYSYYKIAPFHEISQSASSPKRNWLRIFLLLLAMKLIAKVSARSFLLGVWSSEEVVGCKS